MKFRIGCPKPLFVAKHIGQGSGGQKVARSISRMSRASESAAKLLTRDEPRADRGEHRHAAEASKTLA
jgi:hypothetical protein